MRTIGLLIVATALTGCVSARQERAAEFRQALPQLVADCNGWVQVDPRLDGPTIHNDGRKACNRLAGMGLLGLVDPATAKEYVRYKNNRPQSLGPSFQRL